jgi:glycopeptide antibiotics resistance protein
MIEAQFIAFFFLFILISFAFIGIVNLDLKDKKFLASSGCMLSLMLIVGICFFPFPFQDELIETMIAGNEGVANNFIPFHTITVLFKDAIAYKRYGVICYQFFGNIILFMPLGFSLFYYLKENRKFLKLLCCVIFTTVLVEMEQGFFNTILQVNYRSVDIDDVILNTLGGILGFYFAVYLNKIRIKYLTYIK